MQKGNEKFNNDELPNRNRESADADEIAEENSERTFEFINPDAIIQCVLTPENDGTEVSPLPDMIPGTGLLPAEIGQLDADYKALFQIQEKCRFEQPSNPFTYILNTKENLVGAVRKELKQRLKTFGSLTTEPRPASVNVFSLVRDAIARLPNDVGSVTDLTNLLSYSQYLSSEKSSKIIDVVAYCVPILAKEPFPCVSFNKETNQSSYLQHGFSVQEHKSLDVGQPADSAVATTSFVTTTDFSDPALEGERSIENDTDSATFVNDLTIINESPSVIILDGFDAEEVGSRYLEINDTHNGARKFEIKQVPIRWTDEEFLEHLRSNICVFIVVLSVPLLVAGD
ncbi:hypothetical protein GHT06_017094 [Daphnia sinensis]|uniref:Nuclear factor related to kappa-B-binding protein second winged helix domain-containing protein n=1 Tax=Daphnia sinensis TaxID=1820382 RepID=A0AAD5L8I3_9CRUS|nr:hypothetical protein GHT06_017094 [Daphnia sinensis]